MADIDFKLIYTTMVWLLTVKFGIFDLVREIYFEYSGKPADQRPKIMLAEASRAFFRGMSVRSSRYLQILTWAVAFIIGTRVLYSMITN